MHFNESNLHKNTVVVDVTFGGGAEASWRPRLLGYRNVGHTKISSGDRLKHSDTFQVQT